MGGVGPEPATPRSPWPTLGVARGSTGLVASTLKTSPLRLLVAVRPVRVNETVWNAFEVFSTRYQSNLPNLPPPSSAWIGIPEVVRWRSSARRKWSLGSRSRAVPGNTAPMSQVATVMV